MRGREGERGRVSGERRKRERERESEREKYIEGENAGLCLKECVRKEGWEGEGVQQTTHSHWMGMGLGSGGGDDGVLLFFFFSLSFLFGGEREREGGGFAQPSGSTAHRCEIGKEGGGWKEVEWDHCIRVASAAYPSRVGGGGDRKRHCVPYVGKGEEKPGCKKRTKVATFPFFVASVSLTRFPPNFPPFTHSHHLITAFLHSLALPLHMGGGEQSTQNILLVVNLKMLLPSSLLFFDRNTPHPKPLVLSPSRSLSLSRPTSPSRVRTASLC